MKIPTFALVLLSAGGLLLGTNACTTTSFCFADCEGEGQSGFGGTAGSTADVNIEASGGSAGTIVVPDGSGGSGGCELSNGGEEICDDIDNDCNGQVDDGVDLTRPRSCGSCDNDCTAPPHVVNPGCDNGVCTWETCEPDFYDNNGDKTDGCEYYCPWNPDGTNTTDPGGVSGCTKDDDCDLGLPTGGIDEDLDTCEVENCGKCGIKCFIANGAAKCVTTATGSEQCVESNTKCAVDTCDTGFYDVDKSPDNGCEYPCTPTTNPAEVCDGQDNDCDGDIDNVDADVETQDPDIGDQCFGGTAGECAKPAHAGIKKCKDGQIQCCDVGSNDVAGTNPKFPVTGLRNGVCDSPTGNQVLKPDENPEICDLFDNDCDGIVNDNPTDAGGTCGSSTGNCQAGTRQCISGQLVCQGDVGPQPDLCNGQDDNCDGVIDGTVAGAPVSCTTDTNCAPGRVCLPRNGPSDKICAALPTDAQGDCDVPPTPPAGVPTPCRKGTLSCVGGFKDCIGEIKKTTDTDACGIDSNCDGVLTGQPSTASDVNNCGSCGNKCSDLGAHRNWTCNSGVCTPGGCQQGHINCDANPDCEKPCDFISATEQCNGRDDNCNCIDDDVVGSPSTAQVCSVSPGATDPNCQKPAVTVACQNGAWRCTFPATYCTGAAPNYCPPAPDLCDDKDNDCNGNTDEDYKPPVLNQGYLGQPCASDDGLPPPGHGVCRTTGTYQCNGTTATRCEKTDGTPVSADLTQAGPEACDRQDNDCDGSIDEPFNAKGTNAAQWVKPAVTRIGAGLWIDQYEASRPGATAIDPGIGNGFFCTSCSGGVPNAPGGVTLDRTPSCSVAGVVPWFNLTGVEAEQVCQARGGRACTLADWQTACRATASCTRGYNPRTAAACQANGNYPSGARTCNMGPFDFDTAVGGDQDGLLPTASGSLSNCWADWSGLQSNPAALDNIRDIQGNLREITKNGSSYTLMGGAFNSHSEDGASCDFTFYTVDASFKLFDVGFRCCYTSAPN